MSAMTDNDKKLIKEAETLSIWEYKTVENMISEAETQAARDYLRELRWELYDLARESV